jgi:hypothetical protein
MEMSTDYIKNNLNISDPTFDEQNNIFMSNISFGQSVLPLKLTNCKLKIKKGNDNEILLEFLNGESQEKLYDFLNRMEKCLIDFIVTNSDIWFNFSSSYEKIYQLYDSNINLPLKLGDNPTIQIIIPSNEDNMLINNLEINTVIKVNLIINKLYFGKNCISMPLVTEHVIIVHNEIGDIVSNAPIYSVIDNDSSENNKEIDELSEMSNSTYENNE